MSVSFLTLLHALSMELEPRSHGYGTSTGTGGATVVSASGFRFDAGDDRAMDGGWLYWTSGALLGEERPISPSGLTTSTGDISIATPFSSTTPSGATFEVHLRYPVKGSDGTLWVSGYREMINHAARLLWFEDYLSVSGVSGQQRYLLDTATYPWLADNPKGRILDIYGPRDASNNVRRPASATWHIDDDAEAPELVFDSGGFNTGDTFYLKVARPVWTRVKISGVWTDVSESSLNNGCAGVAADSDEIHAPVASITAMVITYSMNALGLRQPSIDAATWEQRKAYWARVAANLKNRALPRKHDGKVRLQVAGLGGGIMSGRGRRWGGW